MRRRYLAGAGLGHVLFLPALVHLADDALSLLSAGQCLLLLGVVLLSAVQRPLQLGGVVGLALAAVSFQLLALLGQVVL